MKNRVILCALMAGVAVTAMADSTFQVRRMTRDDVPAGKGQCDIRLKVDDDVEVSVRDMTVRIRTLSGRGAYDVGSECNVPLPDVVNNFKFEVKDRRDKIALIQEPSPRNRGTAVVEIRDSSGGEGRYHFRLSWDRLGSEEVNPRRRRRE